MASSVSSQRKRGAYDLNGSTSNGLRYTHTGKGRQKKDQSRVVLRPVFISPPISSHTRIVSSLPFDPYRLNSRETRER